MTMSMLPLAQAPRSAALDLLAGERKRDSSVRRNGQFEKRSLKVCKVLFGEQGGGADDGDLLVVRAAAMKAARRATSVLPKPTSPQIRRSIGLARDHVLSNRVNRGELIGCFFESQSLRQRLHSR